MHDVVFACARVCKLGFMLGRHAEIVRCARSNTLLSLAVFRCKKTDTRFADCQRPWEVWGYMLAQLLPVLPSNKLSLVP